ncbi:MAG TPA: MFS transporter, partial [Chondromyces sp.]|nr:MFS transporter [Chondromyces sp.]
SGIFGVIGLLLLGGANSLWILSVAAVFYGISYGTLHPTLQAWAVSQVGAEKKGTANAMILTGMHLGMAVGHRPLAWLQDKSDITRCMDTLPFLLFYCSSFI